LPSEPIEVHQAQDKGLWLWLAFALNSSIVLVDPTNILA
jgi:hypothetical protein